MKKRNLGISAIFFVAFVLWTVAVCLFDVKPVGPENSAVGFSALNAMFHSFTGEHLWLYDISDLLSIIPLLSVAGFAFLGLWQLIKRKSLLKVDKDIIALGVYYIVVIALFLFFEVVVINYRPMLIEGVLEASYPSSTTLLCLTVMPSVIIGLKDRIKNKKFAILLNTVIILFTAFMVIARIISGVHWITDIIGGAFLSAALVILLYEVASALKKD